MTTRMTTWIKARPLLAFYLFAFGLTWLGWIPQMLHSRGLFPFDSVISYVFGGLGPLVAAYLVWRVLHPTEATARLFGPLLKWRVAPIWYLVALLGYPALWLVALVWRGEVMSELAKLGPAMGWLTTFAVSFVAAVPEEAAWRGFALPRFQARYGALVASLLVGILWAIWHLPLLLNTNSIMSTYPLLLYVIAVVATSVIYTWLFNSAGGSLLIVTVFHAASNTVGPFAGLEQTAVFVAVAVAVAVLAGWTRRASQGMAPSKRELLHS